MGEEVLSEGHPMHEEVLSEGHPAAVLKKYSRRKVQEESDPSGPCPLPYHDEPPIYSEMSVKQLKDVLRSEFGFESAFSKAKKDELIGLLKSVHVEAREARDAAILAWRGLRGLASGGLACVPKKRYRIPRKPIEGADHVEAQMPAQGARWLPQVLDGFPDEYPVDGHLDGHPIYTYPIGIYIAQPGTDGRKDGKDGRRLRVNVNGRDLHPDPIRNGQKVHILGSATDSQGVQLLHVLHPKSTSTGYITGYIRAAYLDLERCFLAS